jgi:hypothetical protein
LNAAVTASFGCSDPAPASGMASCTGTAASGARIDTGSVGAKTFTVVGTDVAGNATTRVVNYTVVYAIAISKLKSPANLGSAVPVSWTLKDANGALIQSLTTLLKMESVFNGSTVPSGGCAASATGTKALLYSPATGATGGSNFRLVSGGYQFNWDSTTAKTTGKGCYTLLLTLNDGSVAKMTSAVQLK